jgi:hypothetical protein
MQHGQLSRPDRDRCAIGERREWCGNPVAGGEQERGATLLLQRARPREVVGVEVGLQNLRDALALAQRQVAIDSGGSAGSITAASPSAPIRYERQPLPVRRT